MKRHFISCLRLGALLAAAPFCHADAVIGYFSNPDVIGTVYHPDGTAFLQNNTTTEFSSIFNSPAYSEFRYGASIFLSGPVPLTGTDIFYDSFPVPADPSQTFALGAFSIFQGRPETNSVVFGVTLTLANLPDGSLTPGQPQGTTHISFFPTENGNDPTLISGNELVTLSSVPNEIFVVPEGVPGTIDLLGRYVDGRIQVTGFELGRYSDPSTFIEQGSPVPAPETSSLLAGCAMLGLIGCESFRRRRQLAGG